jgi:hypothetical protein
MISADGFRLQHTGSFGGSSGNDAGAGGGAAGGASSAQFQRFVTEATSIIGYDGISAETIGISTYFVGGGGGGGLGPTGPAFRPSGPGAAAGGIGGGGTSGTGSNTPTRNGTTNTGGGAGGSGGTGSAGGTGGSGVFFVRYPTEYAAATVTGNSPAPSQPGYYVYRWNSGPGTITFN